MNSYQEFMAKYSALNVVRNESGGLSIAGRSSSGIHYEQTVDIETVWLGHDDHTHLDTDMRVSITKMVDEHPQTSWLINPLDGKLMPETPETFSDFEAIRTTGLIGISAVRAYAQLPRQHQRRLEWIVEDKSRDSGEYIDMVPEALAMQGILRAEHDPSAAECLTLFDYALRNAQNMQSLN